VPSIVIASGPSSCAAPHAFASPTGSSAGTSSSRSGTVTGATACGIARSRAATHSISQTTPRASAITSTIVKRLQPATPTITPITIRKSASPATRGNAGGSDHSDTRPRVP
jgi:hypothetical protein